MKAMFLLLFVTACAASPVVARTITLMENGKLTTCVVSGSVVLCD